MERRIAVPREWEQLAVERLRGTLLVVGAPDVGKTTFARYLYQRLCEPSRSVAYLDGDPGQSTLGPPTTIGLAVAARGDAVFPPRGPTWRSFVGSVSPQGHMLPLLVGASRLERAARSQSVDAIVYDTSGLVDPGQGGLALKQAVIDLLQPSVVFGIQRAGELEPLLASLRRSSGVRVIDLCPAPQTRRRDVAARQAHRAEQFARYFSSSGGGDAGHTLMVDWSRLAVYPAPRFVLHDLLALEDRAGYTLGLGIVFDADPQERRVEVYTPLDSLVGVDALRLGDLVVDPRTFRDHRLLTRRRESAAGSC